MGPGVVAIAIIVHMLMRGLALGGFSPTDPLMLGASIFWTEGCLYLAGITRSGAWRDQGSYARWLRLCQAFAPAALAKMAVGLVAAAVLYRLYYAQWYVLLLLSAPGFVYVLFACRIAVGFADSLRRVEA